MHIDEIRRELETIGRYSHTSRKFQDDILDFVATSTGRGASIIEVGCFHGGLTVQLAKVAAENQLAVDVVDISEDFLQIARDTVGRFGLGNSVRFHHTSLGGFLDSHQDYPAPILVFIDGDHRYHGVIADIRAVRGMRNRPYACAFHDFSLRYADGPLTDVRVDQAVLDEFGPQAPIRPIGETAGNGVLRTEPGHDRHFHVRGEPEGVIVVLAEVAAWEAGRNG